MVVMTTDDREWVKAGAKVARLSTSNYGGATVTFDTIERLTATQIVTRRAERYKRDTLTPFGEKRGTWDAWMIELVPADDQRVIDAIAVNSLRECCKQIGKIGDKGRFRSTSDAMEALLRIEELVNRAKTVIEGAPAAEVDES